MSLTPVETHAFANLTYQTLFHVGTPDGKAWRIEDGHITNVEDDSPGVDGYSARALAGTEEGCIATVTNPSQMPPAFYNTKGFFKVIEPTERAPVFEMKLDNGFVPVGVICVRNSIVPSLNDYKVVLTAKELRISDRGEGRPNRLGKLDRVDGKFRFQITEGDPLTDDLAARIGARLEAFDKAAPPAN